MLYVLHGRGGVQDYVKGLVEGLCMGGTKDSQLGSV